jgi:hypothetical protein
VARAMLICVLLLLPVPAFGQSSEDMMSACRKVVDAQVSDQTVVLPTDFHSGMCWGAFASIQAASRIIYTDEPRPVLRVCAPASSTRTQLVAVFMRYAKEHPERLHEGFFQVAWDALRQAFPCK